jgi:uncharacterized protein (DUF427 family)
MRATWNGVTIAHSDDTILLEGNHYFPPTASTGTACRRRGGAPSATGRAWRYYTVKAGGREARNAAWSYPRPFPWIRKIRGHVAFWGGVEVRP